MVSIFRRSPSCFFACSLLQIGSCPPRAGAALSRRRQALRDRGRQGWKAGRLWLIHCQAEGFQEGRWYSKLRGKHSVRLCASLAAGRRGMLRGCSGLGAPGTSCALQGHRVQRDPAHALHLHPSCRALHCASCPRTVCPCSPPCNSANTTLLREPKLCEKIKEE